MGAGVTFDKSLLFGFEDTITYEPPTTQTQAQVQSYGTAVTYQALIQKGARRTIGPNGRDIVSNTQVIIPDRVAIDQRGRVTLPSGFVPQQPPIMGVEPLKGLGMDQTVIFL